LQFVDQAPVCDKQYPNAYYMLASLHLMKNNLKMAFKYTELAEDAEGTQKIKDIDKNSSIYRFTVRFQC
jgi:hypothetical protein